MGAIVSKRGHFGTHATLTTPDTEYELISGDMQLVEEILDPSGIRGTRSHGSERKRANIRRATTTTPIVFQPNSVELDVWLPRILGGTESADSFPLAEALPTFVCTFARDDGTDGKVFSYTGCKVARATFRAVQGGPLELEMQIEGLDESVANAGTFPSLTISTIGPYIMSDCAFTIAAVSYQFREWSLTIDNVLDTERFLNSLTRVSLPERDRLITWTFNSPYGDSEALYGLSSAGVACVATFTLGNRSLAFTSNKVAFPRLSPQLAGIEEIMLPLEGMAGKDGSTAELTTTNDSTG